MNLRNMLAAAMIAASVSSASGAIETPVAAQDFPRPMPGGMASPPVVRDFWQMLRDLVQPKLGQVLPSERWI